MGNGPRITAACIERDELEKIVTKLGQLGLIEIDIVDKKWVITHELDKLVKDVKRCTENESLDAIEDENWDLI